MKILVAGWDSGGGVEPDRQFEFVRVRDRLMFGPARLSCRDLTEELDREPADVVVVDTMIPSALSGPKRPECPQCC